jgi:fumarate reductase subunit D
MSSRVRQSGVRQHAGGHRRDALWVAAMVHRISGLALACFLPLHFLTLGLAIDGEAHFDDFLKWTANPVVKLAETGLVFLLAVHMLGGLRVLWIENMPWRDGQKQLAFAALAIACVAAIAFLVTAI